MPTLRTNSPHFTDEKTQTADAEGHVSQNPGHPGQQLLLGPRLQGTFPARRELSLFTEHTEINKTTTTGAWVRPLVGTAWLPVPEASQETQCTVGPPSGELALDSLVSLTGAFSLGCVPSLEPALWTRESPPGFPVEKIKGHGHKLSKISRLLKRHPGHCEPPRHYRLHQPAAVVAAPPSARNPTARHTQPSPAHSTHT